MEKETDVIEQVEGFHLPEITKLICCSELLQSQPWAKKYTPLIPFYQNTDSRQLVIELLDETEPDTFENDILSLSADSVLTEFLNFLSELENTYNSKRKEKSVLIKKVSSAKKKKEKQESDSSKAAAKTKSSDIKSTSALSSEDEEKLTALTNEINVLNKKIIKYKPLIEKIRLHDSAETDKIRNDMYSMLDKLKTNSAEDFLNQFIQSGTIADEDQCLFHKESFVSELFSCLASEAYINYSLPVLLRLYDECAVDLEQGAAKDFLIDHPEQLCVYLSKNMSESALDVHDPVSELLIETALKKEMAQIGTKDKPVFSEFWNTVTDTESWSFILKKLDSLSEDISLNNAVSYLMPHLNRKSAETLIETLFRNTKSKSELSPTEFLSEMAKTTDHLDTKTVLQIVRMMERKNRKIKRSLNTAERKLKSQSQDLFSSVYLPMEQLEELTVNLRNNKEPIKPSLIASHLIDIVISFREGLEVSGLLPAANTDDWKNQTDIAFDPDAHQLMTQGTTPTDSVRLRSLGFRYLNDDGEWQQYNAHVSTEAASEPPTPKIRKGYPKLKKHETLKKASSIHNKQTKEKKSAKKGKGNHKK